MTTPDLAELIEEGAREVADEIETISVAVVYNVRPNGTVDIQPVTSRVLPGKTWIIEPHMTEPHSNGRDTVIHRTAMMGIRVAWPQGAGYAITWPILPGDYVLLVYSDDDSSWLTTGKVRSYPCSAANRRKGTSIYAVPLAPRPRPAPLPETARSTSDMVLGRQDGSVQVRIGPTEIKLGGVDAISPVAKGDIADANWSALQAWLGQLMVALTALGVAMPPFGVAPYPVVSEQATKAKVV